MHHLKLNFKNFSLSVLAKYQILFGSEKYICPTLLVSKYPDVNIKICFFVCALGHIYQASTNPQG